MVSLVIAEGRITRFFGVNNPQKLGGLDEPFAVREEGFEPLDRLS